MRRFLAAALLIVLSGCKGHTATSAVDQMIASIRTGMTQDQIVRAYSQPKAKRGDPTSGLEVWSYEPEPGKGGVLVYFNDEKVFDVRSLRL